MSLFAKKGEIVTCENGHPICEAGRDLYVAENQKPGDFIKWRQPEPAVGSVAPLCRQCNGAFYQNYGEISVHFVDGWRPPHGQ